MQKRFKTQTCLRLPEELMTEVANICEELQINTSNFMRRAIVDGVQTHRANPTDKMSWVR